MTHENKQAEKITDIVKVLNGGIEFYRDALEKVESKQVKTVFSKMLTDKQIAAEKLQVFAIEESGEVEDDSSTSVELRKLYTRVKDMFSSDTDHTYTEQLEEVEDKVLEVIDEALEEDQPAPCLLALRAVRADMQVNHDQMKALQLATE